MRGNTTTHPVVFENLSSLPHDYKVTEALDILIAGADTTASTLTAGFMHIISNPTIYSKLADALRAANISVDDPSAAQLQELEKIPYLVRIDTPNKQKLIASLTTRQTACVKESLRIAMPVPGRLPRVVPHNSGEPFVVEGQVIPPGVSLIQRIKCTSSYWIPADYCLHVNIHNAYQRSGLGSRRPRLQSRPLASAGSEVPGAISLYILQGRSNVHWSKVCSPFRYQLVPYAISITSDV